MTQTHEKPQKMPGGRTKDAVTDRRLICKFFRSGNCKEKNGGRDSYRPQDEDYYCHPLTRQRDPEAKYGLITNNPCLYSRVGFA